MGNKTSECGVHVNFFLFIIWDWDVARHTSIGRCRQAFSSSWSPRFQDWSLQNLTSHLFTAKASKLILYFDMQKLRTLTGKTWSNKSKQKKCIGQTLDVSPKIQENEFFTCIEIVYICLSFHWLKSSWNNVNLTKYVWNCT